MKQNIDEFNNNVAVMLCMLCPGCMPLVLESIYLVICQKMYYIGVVLVLYS